MKTTVVELNVYEVGDVIQISKGCFNLEAKRRSIGESMRAIVVAVNQRIDKLFSYKLMADNGRIFTMTPSEQGKEEYVGHIDLGMLYGKE